MKEHLFATLEKSRNYTLSVAEAMPENFYNFKPTGVGWNFGELLHHVAYGIQWWEDNYVKGKQTSWDQPPASGGKAGLITYLNKAYDSLKYAISKQQLNDNVVQGFHATIDHVTHHRGQAVLYLRSAGVAPPEYLY